MNIADQLAAGMHDHQLTAKLCVENPLLLRDLMAGLSQHSEGRDYFTIVLNIAERQASLLLPYVEGLIPYLQNARTRRDVIHILCRMSAIAPDQMATYVTQLGQVFKTEDDPILDRHLISALSRIALVSPWTARYIYTLLKQALEQQPNPNLVQILKSLRDMLRHVPDRREEMARLAEGYLTHEQATVQLAAKRLLKGLNRPL